MRVDAATKRFLDHASAQFQRTEYIRFDPISVPHGFDDPRDREIIGLFAAILAWGRRDTMLRNLEELCARMSFRPAQFIRDFRPDKHAAELDGFKHRTFQTSDAIHLCHNLRTCLREWGSLEAVAVAGLDSSASNIEGAIEHLSASLLSANPETPRRLGKHLARPSSGSACKRLSMYFRWMVRGGPFDLGVWSAIQPSMLVLPLDVHSGRQARQLGLLTGRADNWKSVLELTAICQSMRPEDPAAYDFALFGLGAYEIPAVLTEMAPASFAHRA